MKKDVFLSKSRLKLPVIVKDKQVLVMAKIIYFFLIFKRVEAHDHLNNYIVKLADEFVQQTFCISVVEQIAATSLTSFRLNIPVLIGPGLTILPLLPMPNSK